MMSNCCKVAFVVCYPAPLSPHLMLALELQHAAFLREICMHNHVGGTARSTGPNPRSGFISLEVSSSSKPIIADKLGMSEDPYQLGITVP